MYFTSSVVTDHTDTVHETMFLNHQVQLSRWPLFFSVRLKVIHQFLISPIRVVSHFHIILRGLIQRKNGMYLLSSLSGY